MKLAYDFTSSNAGGLGAMLHDVLLASIHARQNSAELVISTSGAHVLRLNGSGERRADDYTWHTMFDSLQECGSYDATWPNHLPEGVSSNISVEDASDVLHELMRPQADAKTRVQQLLDRCAHHDCDAVLHIRRTDKINGSNAEAIDLPIYLYCDEIKRIDAKSVWVCTDDKSVIAHIQHALGDSCDVLYDANESDDEIQRLRYTNQLDVHRARDDVWVALKNLHIMQNARILIGCRSSYFYRIAEILRASRKCINLQDSQVFNSPPWWNEPLVRRCSPRIYLDLIDAFANVDTLHLQFARHSRIRAPLMNIARARSVYDELVDFKWWAYAYSPGVGCEKTLSGNLKEWEHTLHRECVDSYRKHGRFCYRFQRSVNDHYATCNCVSCRLCDTLSSTVAVDMITRITGYHDLQPGEVFVSRYTNGDFITRHADQGKGRVGTTWCFTPQWRSCFGGQLQFTSDDDVIASIVPRLGWVTVFALDGESNQHEVSEVVADTDRFMVTAWYL